MGTIGMIGTALLHILLTVFFSLSVHGIFFALYPTFFALMSIGLLQLLKAEKIRERAGK